MSGLLLLILFAIFIAIFATQNTAPTDISLATYRLTGIPLYFIALAGLLIGVVVSWLLSLIGAISSSLTMHGKDSKISDLRKGVIDMKKKIQDLEVENARLRGEHTANRPKLGMMDRTPSTK